MEPKATERLITAPHFSRHGRMLAAQVPPGLYLVHPTLFSGPCVCSNMGVQIDGRLIPRTESEGYGTSDYWLKFERVKGMTFSGGYLDGMGSALWSCKAGKRKCPYGTRVSTHHEIN